MKNLLTEKKKLTNFEKLFSSLNTTYEALQGEQKGLDWLGLALSNLDEAQTVDEDLKEMYDVVSNSYYQIEDIVHTLRDKLDELNTTRIV